MRTLIAAAIATVALAGCGEKDESLAMRTGDKLGSTVTDFASGIGKSLDKKMSAKVEVAAALKRVGISATTSKQTSMGSDALAVYIIAAQPYDGAIQAKAFDKDGLEIGRATTLVDFTADQADYVTFQFNSELDTLLVTRYELGPGNPALAAKKNGAAEMERVADQVIDGEVSAGG